MRVDRLVGEEPDHQRPEQAADQVDGDHVEAVVEPEQRLDRQRQVADRPGQEADDQR